MDVWLIGSRQRVQRSLHASGIPVPPTHANTQFYADIIRSCTILHASSLRPKLFQQPNRLRSPRPELSPFEPSAAAEPMDSTHHGTGAHGSLRASSFANVLTTYSIPSSSSPTCMIGTFSDTLFIMNTTLDTSDNAINCRFLFYMHHTCRLREFSDHWLKPSYVPITPRLLGSIATRATRRRMQRGSWLWVRRPSSHGSGLAIFYSSHFFAVNSGVKTRVAFVIVGEAICSLSVENTKRLLPDRSALQGDMTWDTSGRQRTPTISSDRLFNFL